MLGRTHFWSGFTVGAATAVLVGESIPVCGVLSGFTALVPDIDEPESTLGRCVPWLAWPIKLVFGHRTITHTLFFAFVVAYLAGLAAASLNDDGYAYGIAVIVLCSLLSHILLDGLTLAGVHPILISKRIHIHGPVSTGGLFDRLFCLINTCGWVCYGLYLLTTVV